MKDEAYIHSILYRLQELKQSKPEIKTHPFYKNIPEHHFEKLYAIAISQINKERRIERKKKQSKFGRKLSFWIPNNSYNNFERWIYRDVTHNPKNKSFNYRTAFETGVKVLLKRFNLEWEKEETIIKKLK